MYLVKITCCWSITEGLFKPLVDEGLIEVVSGLHLALWSLRFVSELTLFPSINQFFTDVTRVQKPDLTIAHLLWKVFNIKKIARLPKKSIVLFDFLEVLHALAKKPLFNSCEFLSFPFPHRSLFVWLLADDKFADAAFRLPPRAPPRFLRLRVCLSPSSGITVQKWPVKLRWDRDTAKQKIQ